MNVVGLKQVKSEVLGFALAYAKIGWYVLPVHSMVNGACSCGKECKTPGKHPITALVPRGFKDSSNDETIIKEWFARFPYANLAVDLEKTGLCCIDVDPRNGGFQSFEMLQTTTSDLHQFSGGGGFHLFYYAPKNLGSVPSLGKGIDFKSNGYVLIEPSNHHTGGTYDWEASSSPLDGCLPSMLPNWVLSLAHTKEVVEEKAFVSRLLTTEQQADLRSALKCWNADDYNEWVNAGLALKSAGAAGFELWNEYSSRSDKYDANAVARKWNGFKPSQIGYESIFFKAQQNGYVNIPTAPEFVLLLENVKLYKKESQVINGLPKLTGVLGIIENYYNDTAPIANPLFAKQCAVGIVSVLLGRRFKTKYRHLTSLYLACIGLSGAGKDHVKSTTNLVLKEIGKTKLLGGNGYTSSGAVISTLAHNPAHITVIDELGHYLKECQGNNASHRRGAVSMLMQCITSLDSHVNSESYSRMGDLIMKKTDGSENTASHQTIEYPAITLMGLTTPSTFFEALTVEMIKDGFYGRFLTVHSDQEAKPVSLRGIKTVALPQSIKDFSDSIDARHVSLGNLTMVAAENAGVSVAQVELDIDDAAIDLLDAFAAEMTAMQKDLAPLGYESLVNRAAEFACRLSLIFELSSNTQSLSVSVASATSAIHYVRAVTIENVSNVKSKITGNLYQREKAEILDAIRGQKSGITMSEMGRKAPFSKHKTRDLQEIIASLVSAALIGLVNTREGKAGGARNAFVALDVSTLH